MVTIQSPFCTNALPFSLDFDSAKDIPRSEFLKGQIAADSVQQSYRTLTSIPLLISRLLPFKIQV